MVISDERAWRELFEAAPLEPDAIRRVDRIQAARTAIRDQIEGSLFKTPSEEIAMRDALATLDSLARKAKVDLEKLPQG
jgi:hypothetical protein